MRLGVRAALVAGLAGPLAACSSGGSKAIYVYLDGGPVETDAAAADPNRDAGSNDASFACVGALSFSTPLLTVRAGESADVSVHLDRSGGPSGSVVTAITTDLGSSFDPTVDQFDERKSDITISVAASALTAPGTHSFVMTGTYAKSTCTIKGTLSVKVEPVANVDPTFGTNGFASLPLATADAPEEFADAIALPNGGFAALTSTVGGLVYRLHVLTAGGALDPTFGGAGSVTVSTTGAYYYRLAAAPDGKILVTGGVLGPTKHGIVLRYTTAGKLDPSFGSGGTATVTLPSQDLTFVRISLAPDGSIYVSGAGSKSAVAKLTALGVLDPAFGTNGLILDDTLFVASSSRGPTTASSCSPATERAWPR